MEKEESSHFTDADSGKSKYDAIKAAVQAQEEAEAIKQAEEKKKKAKKSTKKKSGKKKKKRRKRRTLGQRIAGLFPQQGDSFFEVIRKMVFLFSSTVFMVCICLIGKYFWENYQNQETYDIVRRVYYESPKDEQPKEDGYEYYELLDSAKALLGINNDTVGFINVVNEPKISYPVVQRKNEIDGNEYYLDKDFNRNPARAGAIFMDYRNYFDYIINGIRQLDNSQNLIIYGHNMHDYSMFGALKYYTNYENYYDEHPIIELNSNYMTYQYKVFGMIIVDVEDDTETRFDYWNTLNFKDETEFYNYVNEIKRRTVRLTNVDVKYGDQLLTLSTCNSTFSDGRLVVFARLLREGEELYAGCTSTANPNIKWPNSYYKWHKNTYDPDAEFIPYG